LTSKARTSDCPAALNGPTRTLVVHTGGLGDLLLACPAIAALGREGPIELLGRPDRLALAVAAEIAAVAHDIEGSGFDSLFSTPDSAVRDFLARFDRCVVWMRDDGTLERAICSCGIEDVRLFAGLPPADWKEHASVYFARVLGFDDLPPFRLAVEPVQTCDVVIHPGSGGRHKNWPWECFRILADTLVNAGRKVAWCLGPAEEEARDTTGPCIRPSNPLELAKHLAGANLYIGNDSGATHLAATVDCPIVAIFGPTDPAVWAPRGPRVRIVQGRPWPEVSDVLAAIAALAGNG